MQAEELSVFLHVGMTVSNIEKTIEFYTTHFGFKAIRRGTFSEEFIGALPQLYEQPEGTYADFAFLSSPDNVVFELFQFSNSQQKDHLSWNKPGYHHICIKVKSVRQTCERLVAQGVEFFFAPRVKGDPKNNEYWVFLKDPDGNMIELQD